MPPPQTRLLMSDARYTDEEAYTAHSQTEHYKEILTKAKTGGILAGLDVMKLEPLGG
jgi:quinol monooxygenase YgiN